MLPPRFLSPFTPLHSVQWIPFHARKYSSTAFLVATSCSTIIYLTYTDCFQLWGLCRMTILAWKSSSRNLFPTDIFPWILLGFWSVFALSENDTPISTPPGRASVQFSSVQSLSHVQLFATHELQHTRPPCPSPTPRVYSNSCPLSWWCHPTVSSSVVPFFSCLQSFPASGSFPMSQFFSSGG